MENNVFQNPFENVQFFSIINSIMIIGELLYNDNKLEIERKQESITIINSLCEFLMKKNTTEREILNLGHRILENTEFYGSKINETIDLKFVNLMLDNIIANVVFSKYGNTFGYLSAIVNSTKDLKLSSIKRRIISNLQRQRFVNQNGKFSQMTNFTVQRITENILFPLFPETTIDTNILSFKYIYAQAGWLLLMHNSQLHFVDVNFQFLILLSKNVEQEVIRGEIDSSALKIFQLPALLYYTKKTNAIKRHNLKSMMFSNNFWYRVYNNFFTDTNLVESGMIFLLKQSPVYSFQKELSKFKTRSQIAEEILKKSCSNKTDSETVTNYKNSPANFMCGSKLLPNINQLFQKQNEFLTQKYIAYENYLIHEAFDLDTRKFIDQKSVTIKPIDVFWKNRCLKCGILSNRPKLNEGIDLFQISYKENSRIHALVRSRNKITLLPASEMESFLKEIGLNSRAKLGVPFMAEDLKSTNFDSFAKKIAETRGEKFYTNLKSFGYEATLQENVIDFLLHLIPFYSCTESISNDATNSEIIVNCAIDSLIVIPIMKELGTVAKEIGVLVRNSLLSTVKLSISNKPLKEVLRIVLRLIAEEFKNMFKVIITKKFMKNFTKTVLRSLDPGIGFLTILTKTGIKSLMKIFRSIKIKHNWNIKLLRTKEIGVYQNYKVHVSSMTGNDGFGIRTIIYNDKIVELRKLRGYSNEMPVVLINKERQNYRRINLETGEMDKIIWELRDGTLSIVEKPLAIRLKTIQTEGLSGRGQLPKEYRENIYEKIKQERLSIANQAHLSEQENIVTILKNFAFTNEIDNQQKFLTFWLKEKTYPPWSKAYQLLDIQIYENLRFRPLLENLDLTRQQAIANIQKLYGIQYERDILNIDINRLYNFYITQQLHRSIEFNDQFALANFVESGFGTIHLDDFDNWCMRRALYKTALRQYDDINFMNINELDFYITENVNTKKFQLTKGKKIEIEKFTILNTHINDLVPYEKYKTTNSGNKMQIVHKVKLQHQFMVIKMRKYLPTASNMAVLTPGVKLKLTDWMHLEVGQHNVLVITWTISDFDSGKWLAETTNNIKILNDHEKNIYDFIFDFDTDLLR